MEHQQFSGAHTVESADGAATHAISVMGMRIDRNFLVAMLDDLDEEQGRHLAHLMVDTVNDYYPELIATAQGSNQWLQEDDERQDENLSHTDLREAMQQTVSATIHQSEIENVAQKSETSVSTVYRDTAQDSSAADYLDRFRSPAVCRGSKIWEAVVVYVPAFMEEPIFQYALRVGIQAESEGLQNKDGLQQAIIHLMFHRTRHRRAISRLLDLVIEAEEGLITASDVSNGNLTMLSEDVTGGLVARATYSKQTAAAGRVSHIGLQQEMEQDIGEIDYYCEPLSGQY